MGDADCRCGHGFYEHANGRTGRHGACRAVACVLAAEGCVEYDDSRPPGPDERLVFGVHRLRSDEAETAPAWPPLKGG